MFEYAVVIVLLIFSGLFSGLTLGLMSLSAPELKRKKDLGDKEAGKIYEVRKEGNLLLTTLLVGNVGVNSVLAIFLGSIAPGVVAAVVATALIVVFGEITPQAIFSRFALLLGAKTAWLVHIFIFVLYPICKPISWILDKLLGEELATIYSKRELMKIVEEHSRAKDSEVDDDEEKIIKGALTFSNKMIKDIMTPRTVVLSVEPSTKLSKKLLQELVDSGYSRIPVFENGGTKAAGMLYLKQLLGKSIGGKVVQAFMDKDVTVVSEDTKLDEVFNLFITSKKHLFIVTDEFNDVVGVVSLEDVLEEIILTEIVDEDDKHVDLRKFAKGQAK